MAQIWFTSDLHFSHTNIARFCPQFRPHADTEALDEYMIQQWNQTVAPEDTVYNLGDLSFARNIAQIERILHRLNGRHHLIYGNHDPLIRQHAARLLHTPKHDGHAMLASAQDYLKLKLPNLDAALVLFHYPINEWDGCHKGHYHLYGHLHDRLAPLPGRALNVGWDLHGRFLSLNDIDEMLRDLPKISHFGDKSGKPQTVEAAKEYVQKQLAAFCGAD